MSKIHRLPKNLAELIAAGEVCERPSSVVKELIENSIDAGADKIIVEIRNGGVKYIRITDNGKGIDRKDVPTAFLSHATSKISTENDLDHINTLGFRGEALASVAAVSKTEMLTKTKNVDFGVRYLIEGGEEKLVDDAGCPDGTTILVRDLFYNTPARMKFLKRDATEGNYVSDVVLKTALSHPDISFRLIKDDKETLFTPGNGDLKAAIFAAYGKEFAESLIPCDYELNNVEISGFVSKPINSRKSRSMQHFFVNNRYVKIPFASAALDQAYKNSIMSGSFPSAVLFISVSPNTLDVNVHPAKTEVRFADEKRVFEAVFYAVKNALSKDNTRPKLKFDKSKEIQSYSKFLESQKDKNETFVSVKLDEKQKDQTYEQKNLLDEIRSNNNKSQSINSFLQGKILDKSSNIGNAYKTNINFSDEGFQKNLSDADLSYGAKKEQAFALSQLQNRQDTQESENHAEYEQEEIKDINKDQLKIFGEAFKTYIMVQFEDKLIFIDKHAAHERIIYDKLKKEEKTAFSQALLSPLTITLSLSEYAAIIENLSLLKDSAYVVEDFGEGSVLVREVPIDLAYEDIVSVIEELATYLCSNVKTLESEKLDWLYHNTACRAAIKAGKDLHAEELEAFAKKVLSDPSLKYCPHGRPIWTEISQKELEKQFGRIN